MHTLSEACHFRFRFLASSDDVAIFQLVVVVLVGSCRIAGVVSTHKDKGGVLSVRLWKHSGDICHTQPGMLGVVSGGIIPTSPTPPRQFGHRVGNIT